MDLGPGLNNYINNYFIFCWFKRSNQDQCYVLMMIKWKISGTCHPEHLSCSIGAYLSILQRCSWSLFPAASTSRTSLLLHNLSAGAEARGLQTENSPKSQHIHHHWSYNKLPFSCNKLLNFLAAIILLQVNVHNYRSPLYNQIRIW